MIDLGRLESILAEIAPAEIADPWDIPRFIRKTSNEVEKIGVCVDITENNLRLADEKGIQLLITHHFSQDDLLFKIENTQAGVFLLHSAWNRSEQGNAATLARLLNLENQHTVADCFLGETEMTLKDLLISCQRVLGVHIIPYIGELSSIIKKVLLISGPGFLPVYREEWDKWEKYNYDVILSSELGRYAINNLSKREIKLVDLGHSAMAKPGMEHLAYILQNRLKIFDCDIEFLPDVHGVNYHIGSFY